MSQVAQVWVAYATPDQQWHVAVAFQQGMTVLDAIATTLPEPLMLGIFGVRVEPQHVLQAGDRVEIYRALTINPKDIRRKRAAKNPVGRYAKSNRLRQLK
jgi:putative ubiquitin-RnfH superfamily antitoxin RatB of RatAB toxin-antitoxin module